MSFLCWFMPCHWYYLGAFEQADPTKGATGTQGHRGLYQCWRCKTMSVGDASDPLERDPRHYRAARAPVPYP